MSLNSASAFFRVWNPQIKFPGSQSCLSWSFGADIVIEGDTAVNAVNQLLATGLREKRGAWLAGNGEIDAGVDEPDPEPAQHGGADAEHGSMDLVRP